jgi:hypothetical protein
LGKLRPNQTGTIYLALLVTTLLITVLLARISYLLAAIPLVITLPTAYLTWVNSQRARAESARALNLADIADELATSVRNDWAAEARSRRFNDPGPLPVSWVAADADLVEDWSDLETTAMGWSGDPPSSPDEWAAGPGGLSGAHGELSDVLDRKVSTRRLVVLGEPGLAKQCCWSGSFWTCSPAGRKASRCRSW